MEFVVCKSPLLWLKRTRTHTHTHTWRLKLYIEYKYINIQKTVGGGKSCVMFHLQACNQTKAKHKTTKFKVTTTILFSILDVVLSWFAIWNSSTMILASFSRLVKNLFADVCALKILFFCVVGRFKRLFLELSFRFHALLLESLSLSLTHSYSLDDHHERLDGEMFTMFRQVTLYRGIKIAFNVGY